LIEVCPLKGSLKLYGGRLHAKRIQDLPWSDANYLEDWQIPITKDYCVNDLDTTELLMDNLSEQLKLRADLSVQYKTDLMSKSDAQIAEAVIGTELERISGKRLKKPDLSELYFSFKPPSNMQFQTDYMKGILDFISNVKLSIDDNGRLNRPKEIADLKIKIGNGIYRMGIGGLHSSEENVSVVADEEYELIDRDVASFYPKIVLNCGLYPAHIGEDFLKVYNDIVERRLKAKKEKNLAISECLKITINGTFGKTGSPYSFLYAPEMTIQITVGGQLYLLMLIEAMELNGIQVVSANTDGFVMRVHKSKKKRMLEIIKDWETLTGFETEETKYKAIYSRDVNAYMAIKTNDEIKGKNVYYDPWRGKSAKDRYWTFQKNVNTQICVKAIEDLIIKNVPIETTIKECRDIKQFISVRNVTGGAHYNEEYLGKVVRFYFGLNRNKPIYYIKSGNKVADTDGCVPCMDLPTEFPNDINYLYYIEKTIEMLYDMAYYKRDKQIKFF